MQIGLLEELLQHSIAILMTELLGSRSRTFMLRRCRVGHGRGGILGVVVVTTILDQELLVKIVNRARYTTFIDVSPKNHKSHIK